MKKYLKIQMIFLTVLFVSTTVFASSFDIKTDPEIIISKEDEITEISISFKDIDMNEKGINVVEGFIKYDKELIDSIELINENNWQIKYNSDEQSDLYGKFLSMKDFSGTKDSETFLKIKIRLKSKISKEEGYIILDDITSNDGNNLINIGKKEIKIKIEEENNKPEENNTEDTEKQSDEEKHNDDKQSDEEKHNDDKQSDEENQSDNKQSEESNQENVNKDSNSEMQSEQKNEESISKANEEEKLNEDDNKEKTNNNSNSRQEDENKNQNNIKTGDILPPIAFGTMAAIIILNLVIKNKKARRK